MAKMSSLFLTDEELGKKDDDHRAEGKRTTAGLASWAPAARVQHPRRAAKRLLIVVVVGFLVYAFIANIPTDVPLRDHRRPQYSHPDAVIPVGVERVPPPRDHVSPVKQKPGGHHGNSGSDLAPKHSAASAPKPDDGENTRQYTGSIKFPELGLSLQEFSAETRGSYKTNKNVLFAASSLKSVARVLPVACEMGAELRSYVHFALMARTEMDYQELKQINGIDESCRIIFHDARIDRLSVSPDTRIAEGAGKAFFLIFNYMHPQAIIIDSAEIEEPHFIKAARLASKDEKTRTTLIELPTRGVEKLSWMTKLDSASLRAWHDFSIDILIHATAGVSGSLIRLLRSLHSADFVSSEAPRLTIDLPHSIDTPTKQFLEGFLWPPAHASGASSSHLLALRHRIQRKGLDEDESSVRFLESFWPARPRNSHVLVLSPEAELSPNFFHYLKYAVLEYRHSSVATLQGWDRRIFGFSLASPAVYLNGSGPFEPPQRLKPIEPELPTAKDGPISIVWQAPNSNAMLVLGDKWMELHGFVSQSLSMQAKNAEARGILSEKAFSKSFPAWLEHALRLCRARGYMTLYPQSDASAQLATIHTDIRQQPEEYADEQPAKEPGGGRDESVLFSRGPLLNTLPGGGVMTPFFELPWVAWDGSPLEVTDIIDRALEYTYRFRLSVGGCTANDIDPMMKLDGMASDLFCDA